MIRIRAAALGVVLAAAMTSGCALFNDDLRTSSGDGKPARLAIEPQGRYQETACAGYRGNGQHAYYYQYEHTSRISARSQLCPIDRRPGGSWRVSEDVSIDSKVDTLRLIAELEAIDHDISWNWPIPPLLAVFCWDRTDVAPGHLGVSLYFHGPPHDFTGTVSSSYRYSEGPQRSAVWEASKLEAEAVGLPAGQDVRRFLAEMMATSGETSQLLEVEFGDGRVVFDVSGWDRAVEPLIGECGHSF